MAKNIKIKEILDNSVKVNIVHSPKMAECVDKMTELNDKSFSKVVRLAKSYIRVNKLATKLFGSENVKIELKEEPLVADLVSLGGDFKKALKCAKKYRRANKLMSIAKANYKELERADKAILSQKAAVYV